MNVNIAVLTIHEPARSHALSLQLSRETRERFVAATERLIAPTDQAIRERLTALAARRHGQRARHAGERRDDFLAFQAQGASWVTLSQVAWRKALAWQRGQRPASNSLRAWS